MGYTTHFGVHALGTNLVENNGIMRDYDVIKCESDCAISQNWVFTSNFGALYLNMVHTTKRWYKILKFAKFRLNWGINTLLRYKFGLKIDFIRVWPWKIVELSYILRYTTHFEVHGLYVNHDLVLMSHEIMIAQYLIMIAQYLIMIAQYLIYCV